MLQLIFLFQSLYKDLSAKELEKSELEQQCQVATSMRDKLSSELDAAKEKLESASKEHEKALNSLRDDLQSEVNIARDEGQLKVRELTTQLELARAASTDFEERVAFLNGEISDLEERKKIEAKKDKNLVKDLKKQLAAEKARNEKLAEKMKELKFAPDDMECTFHETLLSTFEPLKHFCQFQLSPTSTPTAPPSPPGP